MLTTKKRNQIVILCGREGYSQRYVAAEFNTGILIDNHPNRAWHGNKTKLPKKLT